MLRVDNILVTKKNVFLLSGGHQYVADIESVKNASTLGDSVDTNPWNLYTDDGKVISNLFDSSQFNVRTQITKGSSSLPNSNKDRHEEFFMPSDGKYVGICQVGDVGYSVSDRTNEKFRSSVTKYDMTETEYAAGYGFCQYYPLSTIEAVDANFIDPNIVYTPEGGAQYISEYPLGEFYSDFGDNDLDVEGSKIDVPTIYGDSFLTKYFYDGSYSVDGTTDGESIRFDNLRTYYGIGYNGDSLYLTYRNNFSTYSTKYGKYASRISADMAESIRFDFDTVGLVEDCSILTHHNADWSSVSVYNGHSFEDENSMRPLLGGEYLPIRSFEPSDSSFILYAALKKADAILQNISQKKFNAFVYVPLRGGFASAKSYDLNGSVSETASSITFVELESSVIVGTTNHGSLLVLSESESESAKGNYNPFCVPKLASNPSSNLTSCEFSDSSGRSDIYYNGSSILALTKFSNPSRYDNCRFFLSTELNSSTKMPMGKCFSAVVSSGTPFESITSIGCIPYAYDGTRPFFDYCPPESSIQSFSTNYVVKTDTYTTENIVTTESMVETEVERAEVVETETTLYSFTFAHSHYSARNNFDDPFHYGITTKAEAVSDFYLPHLLTNSKHPMSIDNSVLYNGENSLFFPRLDLGANIHLLQITLKGPFTMTFSIKSKRDVSANANGFGVDAEHYPKIIVWSKSDTAGLGGVLGSRKDKIILRKDIGIGKKNSSDQYTRDDIWYDYSCSDEREGDLTVRIILRCNSGSMCCGGIPVGTWLSNLRIVQNGNTYGEGVMFTYDSSMNVEKKKLTMTSSTVPVMGTEMVPVTTESTVTETHYRQIVTSTRTESTNAVAKEGDYVFVQLADGSVWRSHVDDIFANGFPVTNMAPCGPMNSLPLSGRKLTDIHFVSNAASNLSLKTVSLDSMLEVRPSLMASFLKKNDQGVFVGTVNSYSVYPMLDRTTPVTVSTDTPAGGKPIEFDGVENTAQYEFFEGCPIKMSKAVEFKSFAPSGAMHSVPAVLVDWDNVGSDGRSSITRELSSDNASIGGLYLQYGGFCTELYIRTDVHGSTHTADGNVLEGSSPVESRSGFSYPHPSYGEFVTAGTGLTVFCGPLSNSMKLGDVLMLNNFLVVKNYSVEPKMVTPTESRSEVGKNVLAPTARYKSGGYVVIDMTDGGSYSTPSELYTSTRQYGTYYTDEPTVGYVVYPASTEGTVWAPFYSGKTIDFIKYGNGYYYIVMHDSDGGYEVVETPSLLEEQTVYRCEGGKTVTNIRFFSGYTVFEYSSEGEPYNTLYSPAGSIMRSSNFIVDGSGGTSERTLDTERTGLGRSTARLVTYSPSAAMLYGGTSMTYVYGQPSMESATSVNAVTETSRYEYTSNATLTGSLTVYSTNMNGIYGNVYNSFPTTMACNSEIEVNDAAAPLSGLHNMFDRLVLMTDDMREDGYGVLDGNGVMRKVQNFAEEYSVISRNTRGDVYEYEKMSAGCYDFVGSTVISGRPFCAVLNRSNNKAYASTDYTVNGVSYYCGSIFVELSGEYDNAVLLECYNTALSDSISSKRFMLHRSEWVYDGAGGPTLSGYYYSFNPADIISYTAANAEIPSVSASVSLLPMTGPLFLVDSSIRYAAALSSNSVTDGLFFFGKDSVYAYNGSLYSKLGGYYGDIGEIFHPMSPNDDIKTRGGASFMGTSGTSGSNTVVAVGVFSSGLKAVELGDDSVTYKKTCDANGNVRSIIVYEDGILKSYCEFESSNTTDYSNLRVVSKYSDRTSDSISTELVIASTLMGEASSYHMLDLDSNSSMYYGLVHEYNAKFTPGQQSGFNVDCIIRRNQSDTCTIPNTSVYISSSGVRQQFERAGWPSNLSSVTVYGKDPLFSVTNIKKDANGAYSELTLKFNESKLVKNVSRVTVYRCNIPPWGDWKYGYKLDYVYSSLYEYVEPNLKYGGSFNSGDWVVETDIVEFDSSRSSISNVKAGQIIRFNGNYYEALKAKATVTKEELEQKAFYGWSDSIARIHEYSSTTTYVSDLFYTNPEACRTEYVTQGSYIGLPTCALRTRMFDGIPFGELALASINKDYMSVNDYSSPTASSVTTLVDKTGSTSDTIYVPTGPYFTVTRNTSKNTYSGEYWGIVWFKDGDYDYIKGSTYQEVYNDMTYCYDDSEVDHTTGPYYTAGGSYDTYSYSRNNGTVDCKSIVLKKSEGWEKKFYSDIVCLENQYGSDYSNALGLSVTAYPSGGNLVVKLSFKYTIGVPYSYIEAVSSGYDSWWRPVKDYALRNSLDIGAYEITITSEKEIDTPSWQSLSSSTTFGLSAAGTLPTSSENRYVVIAANTLSELCRATNVTSVPPSAGYKLEDDKSVNNANSFIKTSDYIALCNLDGLSMLCGSPFPIGGVNHIRVFPISGFITYDYANLNTANSAVTKSGDTAELNPTVQYSDVVGYDNVETVYSINRFTPNSTHKSNLFSVRVDDLGIDDSPYLSEADKENVRQWVKMHVREIVDEVKPANTELFDVILG